jgi:hypothetical protein
MPDFKKTKLLFEEQGLMKFWKRPGELLDDELFAREVQHPNGKYIHIADLPVEYRKSEIDPNNKYPIRYVLQIKRIKRHDGSEWLLSSGSIVGLDRAGNEVSHSFYNPEKYYKPITRYEFRKKDKANEYSPSERVCVEAGINEADYKYTEYTLPFNEKNFDSLYSHRRLKDATSVTLSIWLEGSSDKPRLIVNPDDFRNKPFDDIWQEAITPKFKLDRSYKANLEERHIG